MVTRRDKGTEENTGMDLLVLLGARCGHGACLLSVLTRLVALC